MVNDREITIPLTVDEVSFVLELLNNERYTSNTNAVLADVLTSRLIDRTTDTIAEYAEEDAYWSARESDLNDEHVEALCTARALGY